MLHRSLLRYGYRLVEYSRACVVHQQATFHHSARKRRRAESASPVRGETSPVKHESLHISGRPSETRSEIGAAWETNSESAAANASDIVLDDVDEASAAAFTESGGSTEKFLEKAYRDGALETSPSQVKELLGELAQAGDKLSATTLRNACAKLKISIDAAYTLARLLVRSPGPVDRYQGRQILLQASQLGSTKATLFIAKTATKTRQLQSQELQPVLAQLRRLVAQDTPVIPALIAQARVFEVEQNFDKAADLYKTAIDFVPKPKSSALVRAGKRIIDTIGAEDSETVSEKKITVDDKDTELDVVAAHLGLAHLQYDHLGDRESAVRNWKIAALDYDDPGAYFKLASHLEDVAKSCPISTLDAANRPEHCWLLLVPYEWYEYMMKAAASGHAVACYKIAMFYTLWRGGWSAHIEDRRLRQALESSPLMQPSSSFLPFGTTSKLRTAELNQADTIRRWLRCARAGGYDEAYIALQELGSTTDEETRSTR